MTNPVNQPNVTLAEAETAPWDNQPAPQAAPKPAPSDRSVVMGFIAHNSEPHEVKELSASLANPTLVRFYIKSKSLEALSAEYGRIRPIMEANGFLAYASYSEQTGQPAPRMNDAGEWVLSVFRDGWAVIAGVAVRFKVNSKNSGEAYPDVLPSPRTAAQVARVASMADYFMADVAHDGRGYTEQQVRQAINRINELLTGHGHEGWEQPNRMLTTASERSWLCWKRSAANVEVTLDLDVARGLSAPTF